MHQSGHGGVSELGEQNLTLLGSLPFWREVWRALNSVLGRGKAMCANWIHVTVAGDMRHGAYGLQEI